MAIKRQTFDNGAQGDTITSVNSGDSGDTVNSVITGNGKGIYELSAALRGAKGVHVTGNTSDAVQITLSNDAATNGSATILFRLLNYPTVGGAVFRLGSTAGDICRFSISSTGVLSLQNSVGSTLKNYLSGTPLSRNTNYRLSLQAAPNASTSNGYISGQLHDDSGTILDNAASSSVNAGTTLNVIEASIGKLETATDGFDMHFDELVFTTGNINQIVLGVTRRNTAEGGTDTDLATAGNSGGSSGNAFNAVTSGTITYSSEQVHSGRLAYKLTPTTGSNTILSYYFVAEDNVTQLSTTAYVYLTGYPSSVTKIIEIGNASVGGNICVDTTGKFFVQDRSGTKNVGSSALPLNTWLRLELSLKSGTSTNDGTIIANVYNGDTISSPIYSYSSTTLNTGTVYYTYVSVGKASGSGSWATMYVDDFIVNDTLTPTLINNAVLPWVFA